MSAPRAAATAARGDGSGRDTGRRLIAALAITQTIGYGVLYYAFAVFLSPMARDLHTNATAITGAATLAVLVAGVAAVPVGRWLDRRGGQALMTAGSLVGSGSVVAWSQVHTIAQLYLVFAAIGVASAMTFYEPAFAIVVARFDARRRPTALLAVTIVAGFASSIFLPLTGALDARLGWRHALLALALLHAIGTVPLHAVALPRARPAAGQSTSDTAAGHRDQLRAVLREGTFWLLVAAFVAHSAAMAIMAVHLVTYLISLGHPAAVAATIAGLLGVLSVTGRLVTTGLRRRYQTTSVTATVFVLQAVAALSLPSAGASIAGAITCVVVFGLGFGVSTIARPALLAERYGTSIYATIAGTLAAPATVAKAVAPLAAAALYIASGSYTPVMVSVAAACLIGAATLALAGRGLARDRRGDRGEPGLA
jgi:predicted MFS family arabinose efflux permease